ncbi:NaeI family type II restriction endonuclease [Nocardia sp. XZ_19_369]|uniref:NaeI family type II restriction endonuclease n=1 Tax=Nocardia sp. XZ_19_369 TaxID=2769487 RepID=UPI00188E9451|nr:NaeI family type II restriction endonuclease [Nocardia sp. XZ_19_369]
MSVRDLCNAFDVTHFDGARAPSHSTVQRRLSGEGLANSRMLIEAIIDVCTPESDAESVRTTAIRLLRKAASNPTPIRFESRPGHELAETRTKLDRVRQQLMATKDELLTERKLRVDALQQSTWSTANFMWLLAFLTPRPEPNDGAAMPSPNEISDIKRILHHTTQQRDSARMALAEARRRIQELESRAGDHTDTEPPQTTSPVSKPDMEFDILKHELHVMDPDGSRFASALRRAIDFQLDGSHTGRFSWAQLTRTEKSAVTERVRIELRREFGIKEGTRLDFELAGVEFHCTFSPRPGGWTIPSGAISGINLLLTADDETSRWSAGLVRAIPEFLSDHRNRDGRALLNVAGRTAVHWLHHDAALPDNVLVHLPEADITAIFAPRTGRRRVEELFRRVQHRPISETAAYTVALQAHGARRLREARSNLIEEGIVILGHSAGDRQIALLLGLPIPEDREWVSARVAPFGDREDGTPYFEAEGQRWVLAEPGDPVVTAPQMPQNISDAPGLDREPADPLKRAQDTGSASTDLG